MKKDKFYFGIYNSWDMYDDEVRNDIRESLMEDNEFFDDEVPESWIDDVISSYLGDEKMNLDVETGGYIIAFADVGRWNGRRIGYKEVGTNVNEILESFYGGDECEWYADKYNIHAIACHHDGRNYITFRYVDSKEQLDKVCDMIYNGKIKTKKQLFRHTKSIRPFAAKVYGWKSYGRQKAA